MMPARVRKLLIDLEDTFWLIPALIVATASVSGIWLVQVDPSETAPRWLQQSTWLYSGGATSARTLLGAVASSTIAVVGTVFSITVAALSLATGQMGPRLLRNFTRDRGNQVTLGTFLGTFVYVLLVLRSIRGEGDAGFVPHLAVSVAIVLALICVGTLVYFIGHMASRINVETVVGLVSADVTAAIRRLSDDKSSSRPPVTFWRDAVPVTDSRRGYCQTLDTKRLADWASAHRTAIRLLVRPGQYVFPGAPVAVVIPWVDGCDAAIRGATALSAERLSPDDLEYAVRQLVEVALRALSPGVNDPHTVISVLDHLGATLCDLAGRQLPTGVFNRAGRPALVIPAIDYDGLTDAMFHMIRQHAGGNTAVLIRLLEVLTAVASCEGDAIRAQGLQRHADLVLSAGERTIAEPSDLADLRKRHTVFGSMRVDGPVQALFSARKP